MDCFKNGVAGMSKKTKIGLTVLGVTSVLLLVILVPLSFSYIEYYEYGIVMR